MTFLSPRFVLSEEPRLHLGLPGGKVSQAAEQTSFVQGAAEEPVDFALVDTKEGFEAFLKLLPGKPDSQLYRGRAQTVALGDCWVYLYVPGERLVEVKLRLAGGFEERVVLLDEDDAPQAKAFPADARAGAGLYDLPASDLAGTVGIVFPARVTVAALRRLLLDPPDADAAANGRLLQLAELGVTSQGTEAELLVFDPRCIVSSSVEAIRHEVQHLDLGTAQLSFSGVNLTGGAPHHDATTWPAGARQQRDFRERAILAAISGALAQQEPDAVDGKSLRAANRFFLDFGRRKALLVDGLYNFLQHDVLRFMEAALASDRDGEGLPRSAAAWLGIVDPLGWIATEHTLLSEYLADQAPPDESAWAHYVDHMRALASAPPAEQTGPIGKLKALTDALSNPLGLAVAAADAHTFSVVNEFTRTSLGERLSADALEDRFERELENLKASDFFQKYDATKAKQALGKIKSLHSWAGKLVKVKGLLVDGTTDLISTDSLKLALDLAGGKLEAMDAKLVWGAAAVETKAIAARLSFVGNVIDLVKGNSELAALLNAGDYDAAVAKGVIVTTGTVGLAIALVPIPGARVVGLGLALASAVCELVVAAVEDTQTELFLKHCLWGTESVARGHAPSGKAPWADGAFETWTADRAGVSRQLASLLNVLFRYDVEVTRSTGEIKLEITTQLAPDRFEFVFMGKFTGDGPRRTVPQKGAPTLGTFSFGSRKSSAPTSIGLNSNGADPILKFVAYSLVKKTLTVVFKVGSGLKAASGALTCFPFGRGDFGVPRAGTRTRCLKLDDLQDSATYEFSASGEHTADWEDFQRNFGPLSD